MAAGDPIERPADDPGVPIIEGNPGEPQGPEDALGQGVKRGDYSDRQPEDTAHFEGQPTGAVAGTQVVNGDGGIDNEPVAELVHQNPRAGQVGVPTAGTKGGVDSQGGEPDNEVQTVTVDATTFTLEFDDEVTAAITVATDDGADVEAALEELPNIEPGDVSVAGPVGGPYVVTFGGRYAGEDVPTLIAVGTGGAAAANVVVTNPGGV